MLMASARIEVDANCKPRDPLTPVLRKHAARWESESEPTAFPVFLTINCNLGNLLLSTLFLRGLLLGRVHIVDDDASFRKAIERHLRYAGYEVETYASAQHLLDRLPSESEPGCILLDVRLPGLTGPELQERLRELGSTMPIIFMTGYPDIRTTVKTVKAGAEDFLTKPIPSDQLLQAVGRAVAHHNETRGLKSKK